MAAARGWGGRRGSWSGLGAHGWFSTILTILNHNLVSPNLRAPGSTVQRCCCDLAQDPLGEAPDDQPGHVDGLELPAPGRQVEHEWLPVGRVEDRVGLHPYRALDFLAGPHIGAGWNGEHHRR